MNVAKIKIMNSLAEQPYSNQRELAETCGCSLGIVNRSLKELIHDGYLSDTMSLTEKAHEEFRDKAPKNAVILAAGFGMRMVPINMETPKAFLEVHGERLIERLIRQLHEVGIHEIHVVVGFMKEQFEYLMDDYGVDLIVNPQYVNKNNLHSLALAAKYLGNSYVLPCDIWCRTNPFHARELESWYMVSNACKEHSQLRVNRSMELVRTPANGNTMVGISYLLQKDADYIHEKLSEMDQNPIFDNAFWEDTLYQKDRMILSANVVSSDDAVEINSYEQLRELDSHSSQLRSQAILLASNALNAQPEDIVNITVLKKGMTNRSFLFTCKEKQYIMRIPGEGTDQLINRKEEAAVYETIRNQDICDNIIYIDPETGYKITEYLKGARVCDPSDPEDVKKCMARLRSFHQKKLTVDHEFNIFGMIDFYESLWADTPSAYRDYQVTKEHVLSLHSYIDAHTGEKILTHIDAVPDNFLIVQDASGKEDIRLIDWEYAGMQDPHVDLAMFCIYALYDRQQVDALIDSYFVEGCSHDVRMKIYCYIAACGLLWSNWCEYKRNLGVEFGEYSLRQYRYAKDYYNIFKEESGK